MKDEIILVLSDLHIPYNHRDSLNFLQAIKKKYNIKNDNPKHHILLTLQL